MTDAHYRDADGIVHDVNGLSTTGHEEDVYAWVLRCTMTGPEMKTVGVGQSRPANAPPTCLWCAVDASVNWMFGW